MHTRWKYFVHDKDSHNISKRYFSFHFELILKKTWFFLVYIWKKNAPLIFMSVELGGRRFVLRCGRTFYYIQWGKWKMWQQIYFNKNCCFFSQLVIFIKWKKKMEPMHQMNIVYWRGMSLFMDLRLHICIVQNLEDLIFNRLMVTIRNNVYEILSNVCAWLLYAFVFYTFLQIVNCYIVCDVSIIVPLVLVYDERWSIRIWSKRLFFQRAFVLLLYRIYFIIIFMAW